VTLSDTSTDAEFAEHARRCIRDEWRGEVRMGDLLINAAAGEVAELRYAALEAKQ